MNKTICPKCSYTWDFKYLCAICPKCNYKFLTTKNILLSNFKNGQFSFVKDKKDIETDYKSKTDAIKSGNYTEGYAGEI